MSAIKKFFEKRKLNTKFKKAGDGHKLTDATTSTVSQKPSPATTRVEPTQDSQMAGLAAMRRIEQQRVPTMANRSRNLIRAEAQKELQSEMQREDQATGSSRPVEIVQDSMQQQHGGEVFFKCPLVGPDVLPKAEMDAKIKEFLYSQLEEEPGLTSCLIIHTCNKDKEKVRQCIETLTKCLDNIIDNPDEEKYRKIRVNSKAFQEKIKGIEGALEFLCAAGFKSQMLIHNDEKEEEFYVFTNESGNFEEIESIRDALISAEPVRAELDRNVKVLAPSQQMQLEELPLEFYNLTVEELKREQQLKTETAERSLMLRTKAMREREAVRERRRYRFCFIRIRFPDGLMLQGTFKTWEKLKAVKEFIQEHLVFDGLPFVLYAATGERLDDNDEETLADLGLIPAVIITFAWDPTVSEDILGANAGKMEYLKLEL